MPLCAGRTSPRCGPLRQVRSRFDPLHALMLHGSESWAPAARPSSRSELPSGSAQSSRLAEALADTDLEIKITAAQQLA